MFCTTFAIYPNCAPVLENQRVNDEQFGVEVINREAGTKYTQLHQMLNTPQCCTRFKQMQVLDVNLVRLEWIK